MISELCSKGHKAWTNAPSGRACKTCRNDNAREKTALHSMKSIAWANRGDSSNRGGDLEETFTRSEIMKARGYTL